MSHRRIEALTKSVDAESRTVDIVLTSEIMDSDGDVVRVAGLDTTRFETNPVVLWNHDKNSKPIGQVVKGSLRVDGDKLVGTVLFAETAEAIEIFELYKGGFLRSWSIGFDALDYDRIEGGRFDISKSDLTELSGVPIPANPEALTISKSLKCESIRNAINNSTPEKITAVRRIEKGLKTLGYSGTEAKKTAGDLHRSVPTPNEYNPAVDAGLRRIAAQKRRRDRRREAAQS
jgi:HK97 family phage prohead protease